VHHVGNVQKRGARQTDLDERGLHARQYALHPTHVEIAGQAVTRRALHMHLLRGAVFHQRDAGFLHAAVDQNLEAHAPPGRTSKRDNSSSVSATGRPITPVRLPDRLSTKPAAVPCMA